jgi:chorismate-pyruvate lyase
LEVVTSEFSGLAHRLEKWLTDVALYQDEQTAVYATTIVAMSNLTASLDRLHDLVRQLVGTRPFDMFEEHAEARAKRDLAVFGDA